MPAVVAVREESRKPILVPPTAAAAAAAAGHATSVRPTTVSRELPEAIPVHRPWAARLWIPPEPVVAGHRCRKRLSVFRWQRPGYLRRRRWRWRSGGKNSHQLLRVAVSRPTTGIAGRDHRHQLFRCNFQVQIRSRITGFSACVADANGVRGEFVGGFARSTARGILRNLPRGSIRYGTHRLHRRRQYGAQPDRRPDTK